MKMVYSTSTQLITAIKAERARLEAVLENLAPEQYEQSGMDGLGAWNIKDMLAHLAVWCARAITLVFEVERGAKPTYPPSDGRDTINNTDWLEQRERPLDRILADFRGAHAQLIKRLENWREDDKLFDPRKFSLRGKTLAEVVWGDSGAHDGEHMVSIELFAAKRAHSDVRHLEDI